MLSFASFGLNFGLKLMSSGRPLWTGVGYCCRKPQLLMYKHSFCLPLCGLAATMMCLVLCVCVCDMQARVPDSQRSANIIARMSKLKQVGFVLSCYPS